MGTKELLNGAHVLIDNDLFGIADRLKTIDPAYFVVYNKIKRRFEVHNEDNRGGTLSVVVPHSELDGRTENLVRYTRVERLDKILEEVR